MEGRIVVLSGHVSVKLHQGHVTLAVIDGSCGFDVAVAELDHADIREMITLLETAKTALETQITDGSV